MSTSDTLYEEDFVRWSAEQAEALRDLARVGTNLPLDWENLAEEVESLGQQLRFELESRIGTIVEHLLKLHLSPAAYPRKRRGETIDRSRSEIERILERGPSLRGELAEMVTSEGARAARLVLRSRRRHGEASAEAVAAIEQAHFTVEQVLGTDDGPV
jgi:hypothetical protein